MSEQRIVIFNQLREYYDDCTVSNLYCSNSPDRLCYVLEDVGRPTNVKVYGKTCIPEGVYRARITHSPKYNKDMILLSGKDSYEINRDGKRFTGIRVHGGNRVDDSEGCPLVAYNFDGNNVIWDSASDDILNMVKEYIDARYEVLWVISSY